MSLSIAVVNETDITETVIVNTLASVLGGLGVASSNIVMFDYADWTPSRRLTDRTHAEMNLFAQRLLSGVASVTANIIISLSDTFYTSAGDLKSAVSDEMDSAESDGTLVVFFDEVPYQKCLSYIIFFHDKYVLILIFKQYRVRWVLNVAARFCRPLRR